MEADDHVGTLYGEFKVARGGTYVIDGRFADGRPGEAVVSVRTGIMKDDLLSGTLGITFSLFGGMLILSITAWANYRFGNAESA